MKTKTTQIVSISLILFLFAGVMRLPTAFAKQSDKTNEDIAVIQGTVTVAINPEVKMTLPADMRAGDTISGTVDETRAHNNDTLEGAVFEVEGKEYQLSKNRILTFVVPAVVGTALLIILKNRSGNVIGRKEIPVNQNSGLTGNIPTQLGNFAPPRAGQTGQIISIPGNCDGVADTTNFNFVSAPNAAQTFTSFAESPRETFAKLLSNIQSGPGILTIDENGVQEQFKFNALSVRLSADKLHLNRGESTPYKAEVSGLEGMQDYDGDVKLTLKNLSPQVVRFSGSPSIKSSNKNVQAKLIEHTQNIISFIIFFKNGDGKPMSLTVKDDSNYPVPTESISMNFTGTLTGISVGTFSIHALLNCKAGDEPETPRDWLRRIAELKRQAANRTSNTDLQKELRKNAEYLENTADNKDNWDKDGQPKNKEKFKKFLEDEKEKLEKAKKKADTDGTAEKIGEAMDAVDKAAESAGVELDED